MTQLELANILEVSLNTIRKIEGRTTKVSNTKLLNAISKYEKSHLCKVLSRILFGDIVEDTADIGDRHFIEEIREKKILNMYYSLTILIDINEVQDISI